MNDHIHPVMADALRHAQEQAQRYAADVRIDQMKNSGELQRREADRALDDQIKHEAPQ